MICLWAKQNEVEMHNFLHDYSSNGTFGTRCILIWLLIKNQILFDYRTGYMLELYIHDSTYFFILIFAEISFLWLSEILKRPFQLWSKLMKKYFARLRYSINALQSNLTCAKWAAGQNFYSNKCPTLQSTVGHLHPPGDQF